MLFERNNSEFRAKIRPSSRARGLHFEQLARFGHMDIRHAFLLACGLWPVASDFYIMIPGTITLLLSLKPK